MLEQGYVGQESQDKLNYTDLIASSHGYKLPPYIDDILPMQIMLKMTIRTTNEVVITFCR